MSFRIVVLLIGLLTAPSASSLLAANDEHRAIDGSGNNPTHPEWGSAGVQLLRHATADYEDGLSLPSGNDRPGARAVSEQVNAQLELTENGARLSDMFWLWGQFLDHDIDLTVEAAPEEAFPVEVPQWDPHFDPSGTGVELILMNRSTYDLATGLSTPREQTNGITAFIDASNVYGSDVDRARALRTLDGTGHLKTSRRGRHHYLPYNTVGLPNAGGPGPDLFLAGDVRANEHVGLTALHTLFVREHNRLVDRMLATNPSLTGDEVYEVARRIVGAQMQIITYEEFLPLLLGRDALPASTGYDPTVNPGINNEFSAAAYRFGHSMVSPQLRRIGRDGREIRSGNLPLRDAFFAPSRITDEGGIEPLLRGLTAGIAQELDVFVIDDLRNFLFGVPGAGGFDLASLNIQRGRDHGLCSYNQARFDYGLPAVGDFTQITSNPNVQTVLQATYVSPDYLDLWVGILAEDKLPGAMVGELGMAILSDQFRRLRDGDRFFYSSAFSPVEAEQLARRSRLSDIIVRNTRIERNELPDNVFVVKKNRRGRATRDASSRRRGRSHKRNR